MYVCITVCMYLFTYICMYVHAYLNKGITEFAHDKLICKSCVAVCCSVLQCVAVCGSVLQCVTVCSSMVQFKNTSII